MAHLFARRGVWCFRRVLTVLVALLTVPAVAGGQGAAATLALFNSNSTLFFPAVPYDSGGRTANAIVVADLNDDGKPDLIVANSYACPPPFCHTGSVGVLLGNGDGTFQSPVTYDSGGSQTSGLAIGDFNADGKWDVVVANRYACQQPCPIGGVGVLLGNGDGTLEPAASYDSGGYGANSVAVADVNRDGTADVIVTNQVQGPNVLLGNGDGTLQAAVSAGYVPEYGHSVTVADLNTDGNADLVTGGQCVASPYNCQNLVGVLLGNGDASFQRAVTFDSGEGYESTITAADVNGDGTLDLVAASLDSHAIGVLLGNGDGGFGSVSTYSVGGIYARSVAVADVNSDGKPDAIVAVGFNQNGDSGLVSVLLGNGDGSFQPVMTFDSGGGQTASIAVDDLNADRRPDVVTSLFCATNTACQFPENGAVSVLLNAFCTSPVVTIGAERSSLWPPNGAMLPVTMTGSIRAEAGCAVDSVVFRVSDEYGEIQPSGAITLDSSGAYSFSVALRASRLGADNDGRRYTVTVTATNSAGKSGSQTAAVTVPHDQGH